MPLLDVASTAPATPITAVVTRHSPVCTVEAEFTERRAAISPISHADTMARRSYVTWLTLSPLLTAAARSITRYNVAGQALKK